MKISILDAQETIFEGSVSEAVLPSADGEVTILDDHEPIYVALARGYIWLDVSMSRRGFRFGPRQEGGVSGGIKPIKVHRGLARMRNNELVILMEKG